MRPIQTRTLYVAAAMFAFGTLSPARAANISLVSALNLPGFSFGSVGPLGVTPAPNNDDVDTSPNVIPYKIFFDSHGVMETEFVLAQSGGTTEYLFTQSLTNNTTAAWTGFRFELGFGTDETFILSEFADSLQFDSWENNSTADSPSFQLLHHDMKTLKWGGGIIAPSQTALFTFAIDVPDDLADVHPNGLNSFTLRQTPFGIPDTSDSAVPEPATCALVGLALAGIGVRRYLTSITRKPSIRP